VVHQHRWQGHVIANFTASLEDPREVVSAAAGQRVWRLNENYVREALMRDGAQGSDT
jgi:hypothetical protein